MHEELDGLDLGELVELLDDLEERRTPVGWTPDDAVVKSAVERRIMALITTRSTNEERRSLRIPAKMGVRLRAKHKAAHATTKDIGIGGVFVETRTKFEMGTPLHIDIRAGGTPEHGLRVRGEVSWVAEGTGVGVSFTHLDHEGHERRVRRFIIELLRHRADNN